MQTPIKRNDVVALAFTSLEGGYYELSFDYNGFPQRNTFNSTDNIEVLDRLFALYPNLAKYTLKSKRKKIKKNMTIADIAKLGCFLVYEKIERIMTYSELVDSVLSNTLRMYKLSSDKVKSKELHPDYWKGIRRSLCIAGYSGINVCFLMRNWQEIQNGLSDHIEATSYSKIRLRAKCFQFDAAEPLIAYRRQDCANLKGFADTSLVEYSTTLTSENLVYGDMFDILFSFRYDSSGLPEEQYRCKVVVPLIISLFRSSPTFVGVPEYRTTTMGSEDNRTIDLCMLPKLNDDLFPPVFVVECSAGPLPIEEREDHKDYQRVYRICALAITKYMGIYKDWVEELECTTLEKKAQLKDKINKIKLFGCMTHNLTFQFFVVYPVYEKEKIHIVFEVPLEWRIDLTSEEVIVRNEFVASGPNKFAEYSNECFVQGSENIPELSDIELDGIPVDTDDEEDNQTEPDDGRQSKKRKIDPEQAPKCFYDLAHLLDSPANLLVKCRFIKQFVKYAETCSIELMHSLVGLDPNAAPMQIFKDTTIGESRSNKNAKTDNYKSKVQQASNSPDTPSRKTQTSTMFSEGKGSFCIIKDIGHHELSILRELQTYRSIYICHFRGAVSCDIKNETQLIFEKLARVDELEFKTHAGLFNSSLNYILNGLSALKVLKALKIFHRDISPNNIMVSQHGTPYECFKLIDFGHSVHSERHKDSDVYGTKGFTDPAKPFSFGSDLYSLGKSVERAMFSRIMQSFPDTEDEEEMMDMVARLMWRMQKKMDLENLFEEGMEGFRDFKKRFGYAYSRYHV